MTYAIVPVKDFKYFTIDSNTGVISTAETFDREIADQAHFLIDVEASDKGSPPLSSKTFVHIQVVDDNDMGPIFESKEYFLTVNEDEPLGSVIHFFTVKDSDVGPNTIVTFFISEGNQAGAFSMKNKFSPNGGELIIEEKLDYERTNEYSLKVIATDDRSTSQPAVVSIKVRKETFLSH